MRTLISALTLTLLIFAEGCLPLGRCTEPPESRDSTITQKILFDVDYTNYAWGYHHNGIYIDRSGGVYSYDLTNEGEPKPNAGGRYTEVELMAKYGNNATLIGSVPSDSLNRMYSRIEAASHGTLSDSTQVMADAGETLYSAYRYDKATATYQQVVLRLHGDFQRENLSPEAKELADWLAPIYDKSRQ